MTIQDTPDNKIIQLEAARKKLNQKYDEQIKRLVQKRQQEVGALIERIGMHDVPLDIIAGAMAYIKEQHEKDAESEIMLTFQKAGLRYLTKRQKDAIWARTASKRIKATDPYSSASSTDTEAGRWQQDNSPEQSRDQQYEQPQE